MNLEQLIFAIHGLDKAITFVNVMIGTSTHKYRDEPVYKGDTTINVSIHMKESKNNISITTKSSDFDKILELCAKYIEVNKSANQIEI